MSRKLVLILCFYWQAGLLWDAAPPPPASLQADWPGNPPVSLPWLDIQPSAE
jgi:hypothetical protein